MNTVSFVCGDALLKVQRLAPYVAIVCGLGCAIDDETSSFGEDAKPPVPPLLSGDASAQIDGGSGLGVCRGGVATLTAPTIDDLKDGDQWILADDQRNGSWFRSNDGTVRRAARPATATLLPELLAGDAAQRYAIHRQGAGFLDWGEAVGFAFHVKRGVPCVYDAGLYSGIGFRARGKGEVRLEIAVPEVLLPELGGVCVGEGCGNRHGYPFTLNQSWTRYRISFDQLAQSPGWGQPADFQPQRLLTLWFRALPLQEFEIWVDDVEFLAPPGLGDGGTDAADPLDAAPSPTDAARQTDAALSDASEGGEAAADAWARANDASSGPLDASAVADAAFFGPDAAEAPNEADAGGPL